MRERMSKREREWDGMTEQTKVKKNFNEWEKMRGRGRPQPHITAGNWLLPEAFSLRKIFEPVFQNLSISFIKLVKFSQGKWILDIPIRAERDHSVFSFQHKETQRRVYCKDVRVIKAVGSEQKSGSNYVSSKLFCIYIHHKRWGLSVLRSQIHIVVMHDAVGYFGKYAYLLSWQELYEKIDTILMSVR